LAAALLVACGAAFAQAQPPQNAAEEKRFIVVLEDDVSSPRSVADAHARRYGAAVTNVYSHALNGYAAKVPEQGVQGIRNDPRVAFVEQDYVQHAADQKLPTGINRIEGDLSSTKAGNGLDTVNADIAVLDTGIQKDHPDLNVAGGYNCTSSIRSNYGDGHGHGTHVAGIAAAKDDNTGVVGAAPGARLWAMKVLTDSGIGFTSWIICGIDRVTAMNTDANPDNNIEVANMSLGGSGGDSTCNSFFDSYHRAICRSVNMNGTYGSYPGTTYAVAAGNSNTDLKNSRPATYDEVLAVTAVADFNGEPGIPAAATCRADVDDTSADFSNFTTVGHADANHTIAAPGVCIESTWKGSTYNTISGTSMASPHVAGTAALCIATSGTTGKCTGGPLDVMNDLRSDAAARSNDPAVSPYYGFTDDPKTPNGSRYYGYLEYAGGY
jgi:subtilisin family serine protease